jgi:hypothetical protein
MGVEKSKGENVTRLLYIYEIKSWHASCLSPTDLDPNEAVAQLACRGGS